VPPVVVAVIGVVVVAVTPCRGVVLQRVVAGCSPVVSTVAVGAAIIVVSVAVIRRRGRRSVAVLIGHHTKADRVP
jgi:hypothetical protein